MIKKLSVALFAALRHCTETDSMGTVILRVEVMLEFAGMSPMLTDVRLASNELWVMVSGSVSKAV